MKDQPSREPVTGAPAIARVGHDGETLFVAVTVPVASAAGVRRGTQWGQDDGVEVCLQDRGGDKPGPVQILQGFAGGQQQASQDAGAPAEPQALSGESPSCSPSS